MNNPFFDARCLTPEEERIALFLGTFAASRPSRGLPCLFRTSRLFGEIGVSMRSITKRSKSARPRAGVIDVK